MAKKDRKFNGDRLIRTIFSRIDPNYNELEILDTKSKRVHDIINNELDREKGISNGDILGFVADLKSASNPTDNNSAMEDNDIKKMFDNDMGGILGQFQDLYKNRYIELADLQFITKFIPALEAAVSTTLNDIVGSDDVSKIISRTFELPSSLTEGEKQMTLDEIERIEKEEKLLKKLKNRVYKKTLVSGKHCVYAVPYSTLYEEYDKLLSSGKISSEGELNMVRQMNNLTKKSKIPNNNNKVSKDSYGDNISVVTETVTYDTVKDILTSVGCENKDLNAAIESIHLPEVQGLESTYLIDAIEEIAAMESAMGELKSYDKAFKSTLDPNEYADGTIDVSSVRKSKNKKASRKFRETGLYIKYIDASSIISIDIHDQRIGYFIIHGSSVNKKAGQIKEMKSSSTQKNNIVNSGVIFNGTPLNGKQQKTAMSAIIDAITEGIITNFSPKFVAKHTKYRKLIADCIVANGFVNNDFQIQFVPAEHIIEFNVNDDGDGNGKSMLANSLMNAKMLLSLTVAKLLLYMNKSGNRTLIFSKKSNINALDNNRAQRVIRSIQEGNIAFGDLLSTNLSFSKFNRYGHLDIPVAPDGTRLVEMEVQEGQVVDLKTDYEDMLEKNAIMGTEVPDVIMEFVNSADYAKSIVTGQIKYAISIASKQNDLEEPTTELYNRLLMNSSLSDELKDKLDNNFEFKLSRPKVLTNSNFNDYLSNMQSLTELVSAIYMGTNLNDDDIVVKDRMVRLYAQENLPFIDWERIGEIVDEAKAQISSEKDFDKSGDDQSNM